MLRINPAIRVSATAILKHPWVKVARTTFPRRRMVQLLNNLRVNVQESEFKRFVLRVVAEQVPRLLVSSFRNRVPLMAGQCDSKAFSTACSVLLSLAKAFRCLDRNGDGVLTVEEVVKGLKKNLDVKDEKDLAALFAFSAFDKDRGGTISGDEIGRIVKEVEGQLVSMEVANSCAAQIQRELEQKGGADDLDFEQFVFLMKSRPTAADALNTQISRGCWSAFGVDCYQVRHREPDRWDITKEKSRANRSVYRRRLARKKGEEEDPVMGG
ncbi:Calcium-dependent protein kinase 24 [Symbiodinium microadriaticum]|uniref:Calcium-dependent protein kinase 24 n=1 Tax=Symbiodinium microadriaticum TaxID=2951 RepID=A0A1Q9F0A4_SYMMI|nr:Calcium-dependent protein kinase 24 [Symbiodinium microadriaticum]